MSVFDSLVGQETLVGRLRAAVDAAQAIVAGEESAGGMTHAWLFTGPPGSGRSTAARAFAAALQCERGGCGECLACRTTLAGSHPDVRSLVTQQSVIRTEVAREAVRLAALAPANRRWQVVIVEDADRLHEKAADALLKSLEEPPARTVWMLCAPTVEDVVPTIRSRCRSVVLRTPTTRAVADHLVAEGVDHPLAVFAARASQGHIGRARALALDEATRNRRREVLRIPLQLRDLGSCMTCAANLVEAATEEAVPRSSALDAKDLADLELSFGAATRGVKPTGYAAARKELERDHKQRAKRFVRDAIDRALLDLASFYRDVLAVQMGASEPLINEELRDEIATIARQTSGEEIARRSAAIFATRESLEGEVAPLLALEALMITLGGGGDG